MKRLTRLLSLVVAVALVALPGAVMAQQQGSPVYLVPNAGTAAGAYVTGTPGDSGTVAKQLTVTITPPPGQFVYVTGWDLSYCQDATGEVNTNLTFTTTGFTNLPKIAQVGHASAANVCGQPQAMNLGAWPLKSQSPGTAVTFVSPSAQTHTAFTLNVYAITAP